MTKVLGDANARRAALRGPVTDLYTINYDNIPWLVEQFGQKNWPFKTVIADECSRLKSFRLNKGGVRAAALSKIARCTEYWWNLTGTPAPNGLQDLWGQMWFVDFGERLKRTYTAFTEAYLSENPYTHAKSLLPGAAEIIHAKVADVLLAFRAEDWLSLEQEQLIPVEFNLPPDALAKYRDMEREFFLEIDDTQIEAGTAMTKSGKLLQMCAGSIYDNETSPHHVHDARLQALDDVLDQIDPEPLLVSYWWKTDPRRILAHLMARGISARIYGGPQDEADWNSRKYRVLLLQEQSAFGLNLHVPCRDVMHYSYTWNAELWTQMIGRVGAVRQAQANKKVVARVWYAAARDTIEQSVVDSNLRKISVEDALKSARARRKHDSP